MGAGSRGDPVDRAPDESERGAELAAAQEEFRTERARAVQRVLAARRRGLLVAAGGSVLAAVLGRVVIGERDISAGITPLDLFLVAAIVALALAVVLATGFHRLWTFWKDVPKEPIRYTVVGTALAVVLLTESFAAVTLPLARQDVVTTTPDLWCPGCEESGTGGGSWYLPAHGPMLTFEELYLWHFFDAIPVLKIPETLAWEPKHSLNFPGSLLLVLYKLLVALPVLTLAKSIYKKVKPDQDSENVPRIPAP